MAYRLGIDLGTTNTVASVAADGAPVQLVGLGAQSQQMRSMLFVAEDGQFVVGDEAADRAAGDLSRLIIDPRQQLGTDVPMVVGGQEITAEEATAAMISFAVARATAQQHQPPSETVLSHPAHWDEYKVECFDRAIAAANLGTVRRCTDAEAAVAMYAARESRGTGERVVVYDLGGGSCEVTVLEKTSSGARVLGASEGADHPSGADFDEAIFRLVLSNLGGRGRQLEAERPRFPASAGRGQARVYLREGGTVDSCRGRGPGSAARQQPDSTAGPAGIRLTGQAGAAGERRDDGSGDPWRWGAGERPGRNHPCRGCCRMPIVAELLQREFEAPIQLGTHPEYDVAIGALLTSQPGTSLAAPVAVAAIGEPIVR